MDEQTKNLEGQENPSGQMNRIFERFPSRFPAKFKDERNDFGTDVYLRNASAGGVRITTKERLYMNDNVTLEVDLPDGKDAMTIRGQVIWVKSKDAEIWDVGIKFHKISLMDMWRPYRFTENSSAG